MEKKKVLTKLSLNKKTIATLTDNEMGNIKGGMSGPGCGLPQITFACSAPAYSVCCPTNEGRSCCDPCYTA